MIGGIQYRLQPILQVSGNSANMSKTVRDKTIVIIEHK